MGSVRTTATATMDGLSVSPERMRCRSLTVHHLG